MKKNKYKQKKGWCTSKEKNINVSTRETGDQDTTVYTTIPDHNIQLTNDLRTRFQELSRDVKDEDEDY